MSSSSEYIPPDPVPSEHDAFLASLGHNELVTLVERFPTSDHSWRSIIDRERSMREREVENIRTYTPPPAETSYSSEEVEPEGYINQIRQFNLETFTSYRLPSIKDDRERVRRIAHKFIIDNRRELSEATRGMARLSQDELSEFFYMNLRGIILLPRLQGLTTFESQKYRTVRHYMPGIRINDARTLKAEMRDQPIARAQVEAAKRAVWGLPYATPFPDFFQMTADQQDPILRALGTEWIELYKLVGRHDPRILVTQPNRVEGPLAYHSLATLEQAITQNSSIIEPEKLCRLFLRYPRKFKARLNATKESIERAAQRRKQREETTAPKADVVTEAPPASDPTTAIDPLKELLVTKFYPSAAGQPVGDVEITANEETPRLLRAGDAFDALVTLCTKLSAGQTYDINEVAARLQGEWDATETRTNCEDIARVMPPDVFLFLALISVVRIGNIVLAGRLTTTEDIVTKRQQLYEQQKAHIDQNKISILDKDHAVIRVQNPRIGERHYYMPLDRGNALLAARVITALADNAGEPFMDGIKIASAVWAQMPTIERELFLTQKNQIIGTASAIKQPVLGVMRKLMNDIGLTRETSGERFKLEGTPHITLYPEPPTDRQSGVYLVFPPGTDREVIKRAANDPIPEASLALASFLLEHQLDSSEPLSNEQAPTILDLITDTDVKRALRHLLKEAGTGQTSASVLESLRNRVKQALGEGFEDAWRDRMIGGNHATGGFARARQIGGELPIITNPARFAIKKWRIIPPTLE